MKTTINSNKCPSSWTLNSVVPSLSSAMKNFILVVFLFLGTINFSMAQWIQLSPGIMITFKGVCFLNKDTGLVVGANGKIIKTTDGGITWIQKSSTTTQELRKIQFLNDSIGYIVGNQCILKTIDGGETWTNTVPPGTQNCYSLSFLDSEIGYVKTDYNVLKTIDGGTSWTGTNVGITSPGGDQIFFINQDTGFVIGYSGAIKKTIDGGVTWITKNSNVSQSLESIYFANDTIGYIGGAGGTFLKTIDGGENWVDINSIFQWSTPEIRFLNKDVGYVISNYCLIAKTIDGGFNWSVCNTGFNTLYDLYFANDSIGYVVGNGLILKTTNGGDCTTTSVDDHIFTPEFTIFPNPTNSQQVTIVTKDPIINVQCYDLMGQLLFETNQKVLYLNDLSQGTYLIMVRTDNNCFTKKIIVQ